MEIQYINIDLFKRVSGFFNGLIYIKKKRYGVLNFVVSFF